MGLKSEEKMDKFAKSFCINRKFLLITVLINLSIHQCSSAIIHQIVDFKDPVHLTVNECRASCLKNVSVSILFLIYLQLLLINYSFF